jgi:AraC family transcriptional regulator of arabinose operon
MKIEEGFLGQIALVLPPFKRKVAAAHTFSRLLHATAAGYYPLASYHECERTRGSEDYILLYCVDGQGFIEENGTQVVLKPNSYNILLKNTPHRYGSAPKKPWSIYWIHFNGKQADTLYHRYSSGRTNTPKILTYDKARTDTFNYLLSSLQKEFDGLLLESLYIHLLNLIASFTHPADQHHEADDVISKAIRFMKNNIRDNFELKHFASISNYSVTRFSQLFRMKTGYAPIQYFLQLKIQYACQYLSFTNMNVREVSQELGFTEQFYFSRIFKKLTGNSPSVYRKQNSILILNSSKG